MFEALKTAFEKVLLGLKRKGLLRESDVDEALRELRVALLEADTNYQVAKSFIEKVRNQALKTEVLESFAPSEQILKIVYDNLLDIIGRSPEPLILKDTGISKIALVGLQGSGKTTAVLKLAYKLKKEGKFPLIVAADLRRKAGIEQLEILSKTHDLKLFVSDDANSPIDIINEGAAYAKKNGFDTLVVDTSGRLHVDLELLDELKEIKEKISPDEVLIVLDASVGQKSFDIVKNFNEAIPLTGAIFTKFDGTARGGGILSFRTLTEKGIKFIGTGEKIEDLDHFYPERFVSRILGMGDLATLLEKFNSQISEDEVKRLEQKIEEESFNLYDFKEQLLEIKKIGGINNLVGNFLPSLPLKHEAKIDETLIKKWIAIIDSMTDKERKSSQILNGSRKKRIASGSGCGVHDINRLLKQYEMFSLMAKDFKKGKLKKNFPFAFK